MVLEGAGHRVVEAGKQQQAESLLGNGLSPDFVLWEGNSLDSSNQLRHLSSFISADRICVISGIGEQWMRNAAAGLGVRHVVAKPVTRENLEALMDAVSPESQYCVSDLSSAAVCTEDTRKAGNPVDMPAVPYVEELGGNTFLSGGLAADA